MTDNMELAITVSAKEVVAGVFEKVKKDIKDVGDTTDKAAKSSTDWQAGLSTMAATLGVAFSVGSVVAFGKSVFDTASKIHDTATALDISAEAAQRFKYAAEQGRGTIDDVEKSLNFMMRGLSEGDKSVVGALKAAGLSFHDIRAMSPEEAFLAVTDAVKTIPDPVLQSEVAVKLLGKSSSALMPTIKEGFREVGQAATIMSEDTVNSLESAQDAWGALSDKVTVASGTLIGHSMGVASTLTSSWKSFVMFAENTVKFGASTAVAMADAQDVATKAVEKHEEAQKKVAPTIHKTKEEQDAATKAAEEHAKAIQSVTDKLTGAGQIKAVLDLIESLRGLPPMSKLTKDAQIEIATTMDAAIEVYRAAGKAIPEQWKLISMAAHAESHTMTEDAKREMTETSKALAAPFKNFEVHVADMRLPSHDLTTIVSAPFVEAGQHLTTLESSLRSHGILTKTELEAQAQTAKQQYEFIRDSGLYTADQIQDAWKKMSAAMVAAGTPLVPTYHDIFSQLATEAEHALAQGGLKGLKDFGKQTLTDFTSTMLGAIPVVGQALGQMAGPLIDVVGGFFKKVFGHAGRDAVEQFAATFAGGFDGPGGLHQQLLTLGAAGEQLWIKLTQGVGKNNPAQAKSVIEEINQALQGQKDKIGLAMAAASEYGLTWKDMGEQAKGAHLDETAQALIDKHKLLVDAGYDVVAVEQHMTGAVNDYVRDALTMGREVPEAMRPMLEAMVRNGELVDANGEKITDLDASGITFAQTMTQGFHDVTDAIHELTAALTYGVAPALQAVGRSARGAADDATPAFKQIKDAADDAYDSIYAVSFGHSPGGIKEIPIQLGIATESAMGFAGVLGASMTVAEGAMKRVSFADSIVSQFDLLIGKLTELIDRFDTFISRAGTVAKLPPLPTGKLPTGNIPIDGGSRLPTPVDLGSPITLGGGGTLPTPVELGDILFGGGGAGFPAAWEQILFGGGAGRLPMPQHDVGAYVREDHTARVHAGEIVGPIDFMSRALSGAMARVGGGGGIHVENININGTGKDGTEIGEEVLEYLRRKLLAFTPVTGKI